MTLSRIPFAPDPVRPPADVRRFLREGRRRIGRFQRTHHQGAFAPCDFVRVYAALRDLEGQPSPLLAGRYFCEWGSGFGVVSCLAAMLGFDAWGVEVEADLVAAARQLAADFDLPVGFACGSFIPDAPRRAPSRERRFGWLNTTARSGYEALGLGPEDFDLIFAYPWPDEEELVLELFEEYARTGALLLIYRPEGDLHLGRKADRDDRGP